MIMTMLLPLGLGAQHIQTVSREEAAALIKSGDRVKLILRAGTYVEGKVQDISVAVLRLDVNKSDNSHEVAKGRQELGLERIASVTIVRYKGSKRKWLPVILTSTLGAFSLVVAGGTASEEANAAYIPIAIGFTAGLGVAGYYGGKALDENEVTLTFK
jgi:hypothetical protein